MEILFHKNFEKRFKRLSLKLKSNVLKTIEQFQLNPHNPSLKNHGLKGKLEGLRAISVTGDVRIIFKESGNYITVLMLDVGTHSQVY